MNNSPNINSICWPTVSPAAGVQAMTSGWGLEWQHFGLFGTAKKLKKVMNKVFNLTKFNYRLVLREITTLIAIVFLRLHFRW